jgi:hypothetical protein
MDFKKNVAIVYLLSFLFALATYFLFSSFSLYAAYEKECNLAAVGIYTWIPGLCALFFAKKEQQKICWKARLGSSFVKALLLPFVVTLLGVVLSALFSKISFDRVIEATKLYHLEFSSVFINVALFVLALYIISIVTSLTLNFFFNLGQELFWRGYLWERCRHLGFIKASLCTGLLYSFWFAPLILFFGHNYPYQKFWGMLLMLGFSLAITPVLAYLREKENSVMSSTIFYSMVVTFCPICAVLFPSGNPLVIAPLGIAGILSMSCLGCAVIYRASRRKYKAAC